MAYVSPFGTRKNESGKEFIAPQRANYVSPFKTSRVTAEYSSAYKKEQERLSLVKDFKNLDNLPVDQQYRVSQRLKDAGYFTDEQKTQLDAAIKNSAARQQKGSASILEKTISEVGRGAQRLYKNVTEVFTPTAIKNQLATSTRGATIPTTPVIKKPFDTKKIEQDIKDFTASPNLFISGFNNLSALEQRDLINDLNTTVKEYGQSSNQDLADTAARAAILSKYLTTSTKDLEKENFFTDLGLDKDSLRPAYVKPDAAKLALDIAAGTVQQFKDAGYVFGDGLGTAIGRKSTADINLELYQQKKIDKNQYEVNKGRIDDYFDRLIGTDTSTGTKLAKGVGWAAWAFSWYLPSSRSLKIYQTSLTKSMPTLLKSFLGPVLGAGALNSLSTLTAYERGKKLSKAEFALNFGIGAANAAIPFVLIGARRVKLNRNLKAQGINPAVMAGIDRLDNAASVNATSDEILNILNETEPAVREKMIEVIGQNLTKEEYAKFRTNVDNLIKETDALNLKVRENVELELPETAATTAETTAVTTTTPTADIAVSPARQLAENIAAREDLVLKPTGAKEGKLTKYNIVDGSGKVVGSLKAASQVKADAQFRAIKANPTRFSKAYPKVFQTIKEKAPTKAQVVKKAAPSVKEQPKAAPKAQRATTGRPVERPVVVETTRRAPAARPEAAPVKGRTEVLAEATTRARREEPTKPVTQVKPVKEPVKPKFMGNNSVVEFSRKGEKTKYILRSPEGKDIREITPSERKQFQEYTKARIEAYRASQGITKTASKLEAARAEAKLKERKAAEAQAKADAGVTAKKAEAATKKPEKPAPKGKTKVPSVKTIKKVDNGYKGLAKQEVTLKKAVVNGKEAYLVTTTSSTGAPKSSYYYKLNNAEKAFTREADLLTKKPKRGILPKDEGGYIRISGGEKPKKINKAEAASELEKAVTKAEIPEVPVTKEKKLTRAIAGKPEESVTKGAIRISYQALLSDAQNKLPHITELARFTPEQWKPYHDKYLKDFNTRPEYVDDVIAGRVQETGKFQRAAYTLLKEVELRNAATAEEWFRKSINTNIDKSPVYVRASESGQFLSLLSYFQKRYDLNSVISEIETARGKIAQKMYKTKGRELKAEIANQRKLILDEIAPVTAEDTANLIKSYKLGKKTNPLLKEFIGNNPITKEFKGLSIEKRIKLFTEMGSDQRLELLKKVVGEELALKFASDFERKLLLKNQKLGILNWIQNYKNVDPAIKRDLVSQLTKLERILVTNGVENQLDNYINTVLGIRPQMSELKTLFELNQKADKAHQAVLDKFGATKKNDDAWFYATDDPYYKPSKEEIEYGLARAQLREYAMNMQKPTMKQELEIWKNRELLGKVGQAVVTLGNWVRAFVASFDNSALGRQANLVLKTHPKIWLMGAKAGYTTMIRALKAKTPAELNAIKLAFEAAILADPWANDFAEAGLAILKADDMFLSSGPGNLKIKVGDRYIQVGKPLKASELAYDMTIQTMRLALAKKLYTKGYKRLEKLNKQEALKYAKDTDFTRIDMDPDFKRNLMVMINSMTGRGEFKSATAEKAVPAMNVVLFSTRWTKSQFDKITQGFFGANIGGVQYVVNGQKHWNPVQRMAAANLLKAFAVNASILAMAEMLIPGSTETDYRSADAGKIKIGTTRFDITGGMNQIMTLGARAFSRATKNSNTGVVSKLNSEEWGSRTIWNVLDDFFTNKLSPAAGEVARILKGKDIQRADPSVEATLQRIITPMLFKNLFETGADPNAVPAWIAAFFDFNGISTNTYAAKGQGRLGNEWDNSSKGAVKAFRESVDKDVFAQAAAERDDLFNTFVVNLIKTPTYQNANDVDKKYILEKADAEIQERIFKKYGFKYKKQEVRTKQQTEQYKNLIKSNL